MSKNIQPIRGFNDILPEDSGLWQYLENTVRDVLQSYGYAEIRLPLLEKTELFKRSIGETTDVVEKEMYTFADRNDVSLTLRPEATAGIVRAGISNSMFHNATQRLWCAGPMFRYERPQKGRYRQFHQIDVEAFGFIGPDIDAEMILMSARIWKLLGIGDLSLHINSLGSPESRKNYRAKLTEYFRAYEKDLDDDSRRRLDTNPLRILDSKNSDLQDIIAGAPSLLDHIDADSRDHFDGLCRLLEDNGVSFTINPRLVRGLDYYSRTVFEWITGKLGAQDAVCSGGRYDGLVELMGGGPTPGIGWAMGVERLIALMRLEESEQHRLQPDIYLALVGEQAELQGCRFAETLRDAVPGLKLTVNCGGGSFKSQLKRADKSGARLALIIGEDEAQSGRVTVKRLREQAEQETLSREDVIGQIPSLLA